MAKKDEKLTLVPAAQGLTVENPFIAELTKIENLPDAESLQTISTPPLVKPTIVPVGVTISGEVVQLVQNFSGSSETSMRESLVLHLKHSEGKEFYFPVTGTIKRGMGAAQLITYAEEEGKDEKGKKVTFQKAVLAAGVVGRRMFFTRQPDGQAKKFGGKPMFMFDVKITKE
jgi:hypothetical protein